MSNYINCPHCGERLKVRTSRDASSIVRELYLQCENVQCAFTCKAHLALVNTIAPSMVQKKGVYIPMSRVAEKRAADKENAVNQIGLPGLDTMSHPRDMPHLNNSG